MSEPVPRRVEMVGTDRSSSGKRKRMSPERQREINERIELCRELLRKNWTRGDIKRAFKQRFNVSARTAERYMCLARKRNLEILDRTEDEAFSATLGFWAKKQRDCDERISAAKRLRDKAIEAIESANLVLGSPNASKNQKALAMQQLKESTKILDDSRRTIFSCEKFSMDYQDRLDKLLGLHRPAKLALTDSKGQDIKPHVPREAVSPAEEAEELRKIYEQVQRRTEAIAAGVPYLEAMEDSR